MMWKTRKRQLRAALGECVQPAIRCLILAWGAALFASSIAAVGFADGFLNAQYPLF